MGIGAPTFIPDSERRSLIAPQRALPTLSPSRPEASRRPPGAEDRAQTPRRLAASHRPPGAGAEAARPGSGASRFGADAQGSVPSSLALETWRRAVEHQAPKPERKRLAPGRKPPDAGRWRPRPRVQDPAPRGSAPTLGTRRPVLALDTWRRAVEGQAQASGARLPRPRRENLALRCGGQ